MNGTDYSSLFTAAKALVTIPETKLESIDWGVVSGSAQTNNFEIYQIFVDDNALTQGTPVKVVSKDEDANTIIVDGGDWLEPGDTTGQDRSQAWNTLWTGLGQYQVDPVVAFSQ